MGLDKDSHFRLMNILFRIFFSIQMDYKREEYLNKNNNYEIINWWGRLSWQGKSDLYF